MGEVVNLNRYRKMLEQRRRSLEAVASRARSGRTRVDVRNEAATRDRLCREHDGKEIDEPA